MRPLRILVIVALATVLASAARAQVPAITLLSPQPIPAGTGAVLTITGSNFGAPGDSVFFPGRSDGVAPSNWGSGFLEVPVPETWSGNIRVLSDASGLLSGPFPVEITYNWSGQSWPSGSLPFTWYLNQSGAPGVALGDVAGALTKAYDTWQCASSATITYGGTTASTGYNHGDGLNVQYWDASGWSDPNVIAVTTFTYNASTNEIFEEDIHYNAQNWTWAVDGNTGAVDIQNVATHEEGHSLGLLDMYGAADAAKTMHGNTGNGDLSKRTLDEADAEGIEHVYPHAGRANLLEGTPSGWWGPVVPNDAAVTSGNVPLPPTLVGNLAQYVNFAQTNDGLDCAAPSAWADIRLDAVPFARRGWAGTWSPGYAGGWLNVPVTVRGGRHTFTVSYDPDSEIQEANESDNFYSAQFSWSPYGLADQVPVVRALPPDRGSLASPNCDGFQLTGNWWAGVAIVGRDSGDDYDLRLFDDYTGSTQGYQSSLVSSAYIGGYTDFVIVNGNVEGYGQTYWAGTVRWNAGVGSDVVVSQSNQVGPTLYPPSTYGDSVTTGVVSFSADQLLKIHEVYLGDTDTTYTFHLHNESTATDLGLALFSASGSWFGRGTAAAASENLNPGLDETIDYKPPAAGFYGVAVFKQGSADAALTADYELTVGAALSNLDAGVTPPGFSSPVVPRNTADAGAFDAQLPAAFDPPGSQVYLNWSVEQEGPNCTPPMATAVWYDVENFVTYQVWPGVTRHCPGPWWAFNVAGFVSDGGRHSVELVADTNDSVPETDETDNVWTGQWVWPPRPTARAVPQVRPQPPNRGVLFLGNCDGFSYSHTPGLSWVVGIAPLDPADDYDLYVYDDYSGSQSGFSHEIGHSTEVAGATDFVVGQYYGAPPTVYAGTVRFYNPSGDDYVMDQTDANGRSNLSVGSFPHQVLDQSRVVDVYEAYLTQGDFTRFTLHRNSGTADLAVAVFRGIPGSVTARDFAAATSLPIGSDDDLAYYEAQETDWHPVVVYRTQGGDLTAVDYSLDWEPVDPTGVPSTETGAASFSLLPASPNPFRRATRIAFDLPGPSRVTAALFDARGRKVRDLAGGSYPAGRHVLSWDGRDNRGARSAAGIYYARVTAGSRSFAERLTLLP